MLLEIKFRSFLLREAKLISPWLLFATKIKVFCVAIAMGYFFQKNEELTIERTQNFDEIQYIRDFVVIFLSKVMIE